MELEDINIKIKQIENEINKLEIQKEELIKKNSTLEVEKGIIEDKLNRLKKELKEEFELEDLDEKTIEELIKNLKEQLEKEEGND